MGPKYEEDKTALTTSGKATFNDYSHFQQIFVRDLEEVSQEDVLFVKAVEKVMGLAHLVEPTLFPIPYEPIIVESFEYEAGRGKLQEHGIILPLSF